MSNKSDLIEKRVDKEYKSIPAFLVKADEEKGITTVIANVFGIVDDGDDLIPNGAFTKTISERFNRIRRLDQHRMDSVMRVIGKLLAIREVGRDELPAEVLAEYPEATGGLEVTTQYLMDTPEGLGAFRRVAAGAVNEYSIGFDVVDRPEYRKMTWRGKEINVRILKQIRLWEVSDVIFGMNPATTTTAVKELTADGPIQRLGDYLYASIRRAANYNVDDFLACGFIDQEQHKVIVNALNVALDTFTIALPESLALTPLNTYWGMCWMAAMAAAEAKRTIETEQKAGRVLSEVNAQRINDAYNLLHDVLLGAGLIDEEGDLPEETETYVEDSQQEGSDEKTLPNPSEQSENDGSSLDNPATPPALVEPPSEQVPQALTEEARKAKLAEAQTLLQSLGGA
jgi:HK97 family phage prohead protease